MTLRIVIAELQTPSVGPWCFLSGRNPLVQIKFCVKTDPHRTVLLETAQGIPWEHTSLIRLLILSKETETQKGPLCSQTPSQPPLVAGLLPWDSTSVLLWWTPGTCNLSKSFIGDDDLQSGLGIAGWSTSLKAKSKLVAEPDVSCSWGSCRPNSMKITSKKLLELISGTEVLYWTWCHWMATDQDFSMCW